MNKLLHKKAFTLAETLIVLIIIGVVAALTIPSVVAKYQKQKTVVQLKKIYTSLYNAYQRSLADNIPPQYWDTSLSAKDFYLTYLGPYLSGTLCQTNKGKGPCATYYAKDGIENSGGRYIYPAVLFSDGTTITDFAYDNGFRIFIDLNGYEKPNIFGKDLFIIGINNYKPNDKNGERFGFFCQYCGGAGFPTEKSRDSWKKYCTRQKCWNGGGLIQYDNWQIKDDYPW